MVKRENQLDVTTGEPAFLSFYFSARCFFTVLLVPVFTLLYALGILYVIMPLRLLSYLVDMVGMAILSLHELVELLPAWVLLNFGF